MLKKKLLVAALVAAFAAPAMAEEASPFSANVSITSDYLYRGISQTGRGPAIQGGFDYAHPSGLYAGVWGSSISWLQDAGIATHASTELDTYAGYKGAVGDIAYDAGFLRYNYPGDYAGNTKANTNELYGAVSYSIITAKLSYSLGDTFGVNDAAGTVYYELNASYALEELGLSLGAHLGRQDYKGSNAGAGATNLSYTDYKLSASKDVGGYVLGLAFSDTNASAAYTVLNKKLGKSTVVASLSHSF
ncbi:TorF family putative porin [Ferrigenium sp. UT4]